ncbi:hypothetical protein AB4K20DRAFT_1872125, partial [Rhizopus microsporus]
EARTKAIYTFLRVHQDYFLYRYFQKYENFNYMKISFIRNFRIDLVVHGYQIRPKGYSTFSNYYKKTIRDQKRHDKSILIGGGCSCCAGEAPVILEVVVELLDGAHLAHGLSVLKRVSQSVLQTNKFKSIKIFLICSSRLRPLPTKEIELVGAADGSR